MSEIPHGPSEGQESDRTDARACLARFLEAAGVLSEAWSPILDVGSYPRYLPSFDEFIDDLVDWRDEVEERRPKVDPTEPLNLSDRGAMRTWLQQIRIHFKDALSAGEDATRPPGERDLGRRTARKLVLEARNALDQLLRAAERGLD